MSELFDSHAHLNDRRLYRNLEKILARAYEAGVSKIICPGYDIESSRLAVEIAQKHEMVWASVGIHPHDAKHLTNETLNELKTLAQNPRTAAIGETGLDFYRNLSPHAVQENSFRAHIRLAKELNMPIIVHDRDSSRECLRILADEGIPPAGGVFHCFSQDAEFAQEVIKAGLHIGIAGPVTFEKSDKLKKVAETIPLDKLLIETDAPYLTPEPFRGRQDNEPSLVKLVAEKIAGIRKVDFDKIAKTSKENAERLFYKIGK